MTHTEYTKLILNIKDNNIYFNQDCLKIVNINGVDTKVFHGYLTYILNVALNVDVLMKVMMILLNGTGKEIAK